jgi:hypothetical protein
MEQRGTQKRKKYVELNDNKNAAYCQVLVAMPVILAT